MFVRFGKILSFLVCLYLVGGHWAVLQSVAWIGMLADYGRAYGVEKAVEMTFDGAHPCAMCRGIQKKKSDETRQQVPGDARSKIAQKAVLQSSQIVAGKPASQSSDGWAAYTFRWIVRRAAPPDPVPRKALA